MPPENAGAGAENIKKGGRATCISLSNGRAARNLNTPSARLTMIERVAAGTFAVYDAVVADYENVATAIVVALAGTAIAVPGTVVVVLGTAITALLLPG